MIQAESKRTNCEANQAAGLQRRRPWYLAFLLPFSTFLLGAPQQISFNRDIRPIMSDTCFRCHGPDAGARMAGMRLDIRHEALKQTESGVTPIVPGEPERSAIVQRIFST